jgi:lipid-binding SYLF domain-containing protein
MTVFVANFGGTIMKAKLISGLVVACLAIGMVGSAIAAWDPANEQRSADTVSAFKKTDPGIDTFFKESHAYVVFPEITKGAIGIGGAAGDGTVFERGTTIGSSSMTQVTIGLQFGGQTYSEVIFFNDKTALDKFEAGNYAVAAGASAIALKEGASETAGYNNGVAIFTMGTGGLMFEASVGGQKFSFEPK